MIEEIRELERRLFAAYSRRNRIEDDLDAAEQEILAIEAEIDDLGKRAAAEAASLQMRLPGQ